MAGMLTLFAAPALSAAKTAGPWAPVDAFARKMIADRLVPGLQICVRRRGATAISRGFGLADIETATPMTPATVCRIGSVSKQFTAAGVLLLVQDGKVSLDDPLSRFFPDFKRRAPDNPAAAQPHVRPRQLHRDHPAELIWQIARTDRTSAEMLEVMRTTGAKLLFEPGTSYRYSNTGFVLLGLVIEKASGQALGEFLQARLFTPQGLARTALDDAAQVVPSRAAGYTDDPKAPSGFDNASFTSMTYPGGAGALRSTCEDLCAWHEALLGGRVLQPAMLKAMLTPIALNDGSLPMQPNRKGERTAVRYGFGIGVNPVDGKDAVSHGGSIQGFGSFLETLPAERMTMALIINTDGGAKAPASFGPAWAECCRRSCAPRRWRLERSDEFLSMRALGAALALAMATAATAAEPTDPKIAARVDRVLAKTPLIDGHNDLPWEIRIRFASKLEGLDLKSDTSRLPSPEEGGLGLMTDIPRMRAGHMGGQFWSVWIPSSITGPAAVQTTIEQIDIVKRMAERYPADFEMAYTADDIVRIHAAGRMAALIGVEGGNQINESLASLRQLYAAGARYMTLTHATNIRWGGLCDGQSGPWRPDPVRQAGGGRDEPHGDAGRP